ncbi:rubber cis-polyprenyltransferase HRT2 [Manihot esculenta]|uniref:Alkyl transferase n=1 Tax=Manihot esculenta TaxID=3983 RepID=A0A2C9VNC2_MANES|nr:rubber cis-polyprenyltransferase HRT2 [Manihot esculenta]OAY47225.1 hypothetical protein MANES_06G062700v8 [Manihot esculenta]
MDIYVANRPSLLAILGSSMRKCIFRIISKGPIPSHLAFILDGNRRFAKKENLDAGAGYRAGFSSLLSTLKYCYELGVKYVTIFAFSIDNFRRRPDEVQKVMDLVLEKTEGILKEESLIDAYGIGVRFVGNLKLLSEPVRVAAEKAMKATAKNTRCVLFICVAYTSTDEIVHSVQESCKDKSNKIDSSKTHKACNGIEGGECGKEIDNGITLGVQEYATNNAVTKGAEVTGKSNGVIVNSFRTENGVISVGGIEKMPSPPCIKKMDIEKQMYLAAPEPDILIRTSGENRLSNFLLWQTSTCLLYSPAALWPEIGLRHLAWAVINFQRTHSYLEEKKKYL